jgi:hypothetical protein
MCDESKEEKIHSIWFWLAPGDLPEVDEHGILLECSGSENGSCFL